VSAQHGFPVSSTFFFPVSSYMYFFSSWCLLSVYTAGVLPFIEQEADDEAELPTIKEQDESMSGSQSQVSTEEDSQSQPDVASPEKSLSQSQDQKVESLKW
jgi:hypothetical protein